MSTPTTTGTVTGPGTVTVITPPAGGITNNNQVLVPVPATSTQTSGPSGTKIGLVSVVNIVFITLMIGMFYSVCSDPTFVPKDNLVTLLLTGAVIAVLSILTLIGLGYAAVGAFDKDQDKKQKELTMAYSFELTSLLIIIILGLIGLFVGCLVTPGATGSTPFESFLIFNSIGSCIGPCFSVIGEILGSIKF